jgi:hypothetical protein
VDVKALGLEAGETVGDGLEPFADGIQMIEAFLQAEVAQVVGAEFVAQETGKLLILFDSSSTVGDAQCPQLIDSIRDDSFRRQNIVSRGIR